VTPTPTKTDLQVVTFVPHAICNIVGTILQTPVPSGDCSVLIAKVAPPNATGTVEFKDTFHGTTTSLGTVPVGLGGFAVKLTPALASGTHVITATFTDATAFGSSSDTDTVTVR
jgi:hypothetical protein